MQAMKLLNIFTVFMSIIVSVFLCSCGEKTPEEIAQINKRKSDLAVRRAQVLTSENKLKQAIEILETTLRECGTNAKVCEALANALIQDGQTASAGMFYEQAFDADNTRPELLIFAANSYEQTGSIDAAGLAFEKYIKKVPNDSSIIKNLAKIYEKQGHFDKSLNTYMSAIKLENRNPNTSEASVIGGLFAKLGNMVQAKLWLETALKVTLPENKITRKEIGENLIVVYLDRKEWDNLEKTIIMLDEIDPQFVNKKYPTLKARLAEFKHKLAEVEETLNADKTRKQIEEENAKIEQEAKQKELELQKAKEQQLKEQEQKQTQQPKDVEQSKQQSDKKATVSEKTEEKQKTTESSTKENKEESKQVSQPKEDSTLVDAPIKEQIVKTLPQEKVQPIVKKPEQNETDIQMYIRLTKEAIKTGDKSKALEYAHKAYQENTKSTEAWSVMADAYEANGMIFEAYLAANEAYLVELDSPQLAARLLFFTQKTKNPETFLKKALSMYDKFPNSAEVSFYLAEAYALNKNTAKAKQMYKKVVEIDESESDIVKKAQEYLKNN
ncbi:MAG: hypothetical protein E7035_00305 [Verrucomicrobiaceae bacterium]|nr:hypothetical protein [Verrucomicrobiaceae bacterium]